MSKAQTTEQPTVCDILLAVLKVSHDFRLPVPPEDENFWRERDLELVHVHQGVKILRDEGTVEILPSNEGVVIRLVPEDGQYVLPSAKAFDDRAI